MPSRSRKSSVRNLKLTLEYNGSKFFGFQRQKERPTIQGELERALTRLLDRPTKIGAAAGRTDAGVHALGQVVHFKTGSSLPAEKIQRGLNAFLPKEIAVREVEEAPFDFHARYGARWKTYEYRILNSKIRSPLLNGSVYQYPYKLNLVRMRRAARKLIGRHDFKAFQAAGSAARTSNRFVRRLIIHKRGDLVHLLFEADGFLYHMVRNIVGTLLEVGRGSLSLENFKTLFKKGNRSLAGPKVPSQGLVLLGVTYSNAGKVEKSGRF